MQIVENEKSLALTSFKYLPIQCRNDLALGYIGTVRQRLQEDVGEQKQRNSQAPVGGLEANSPTLLLCSSRANWSRTRSV